MLNPARLAQAMRDIATFIEPFEFLPYWDCLIRNLYELHDSWPQYVHRPRRLLKDDHHWIYVITVGHGSQHEIVNFPHGGEVWRISSLAEHILFLCENPWLLEDRTIHFVLDTPAAMSRNLRRWGWVRLSEPSFGIYSILRHWRHAHPDHDTSHSYPVMRDGRLVGRPTPGVLANIQVIDEIESTAGAKWVGSDAGHNKHAGAGTHFHVSGPDTANTALTIPQFEDLARFLDLNLDHGPPDSPSQKLYPGTEATYEFNHLATWAEYDPTTQAGGTIYDYGLQRPGSSEQDHPFALATEVPMLRCSTFLGSTTRRRALRVFGRRTFTLKKLFAQVAEIALRLPDDPDVSATRCLITGPQAWSTRQDQLPLDEKVHADEVATIVTANTLYVMRRCGPVFATFERHRSRIEAMGKSHVKPFQELDKVTDVLAHRLVHMVELVPPHQATALQIMAHELASAGARGVHLDGPLS